MIDDSFVNPFVAPADQITTLDFDNRSASACVNRRAEHDTAALRCRIDSTAWNTGSG
jgi:hypothetical protein